MEVLAGVIIGALIMYLITRAPITININTKTETVTPLIAMPDMEKELRPGETPMDKVYKDDMKGLLDGVNEIMLGGKLNGEANKG